MADAAYTLGSTLAQLGISEATVKRLLAEKLAASDENRRRSLMSVNDSASSRGMLQGSQTLIDRADTNLDYDREVAGYNAGANDDLARMAQQRLDAQAAYNNSVAQEQAKQAADQEALKIGFDPADPFNWKGIQAAQLAGQIPSAQPAITPVPGGSADDPFNWKGIAASQKPKVVQPPRKPTRPTPAPPPRTENRPAIPRPGQVVRF